MKHQIILRVRTTMSLESLVRSFPKTVLVKNPEAEKSAAGHSPIEVVYVEEVTGAGTYQDMDKALNRRVIE